MHQSRTKVVLVGGPDVDSRIDLIEYLQDEYEILAVGSEEGLAEKFHYKGMRYATYDLNRRLSPLSDARSLAQLYSIFKKEKPDIVHTFDTKPCVLGRLAAKLANVPVILGTLPGLGSLYSDSGGSILNQGTKLVYEQVQRAACHLADLTIFQNTDDARQFAEKGIVPPTKSSVISGSGVRTDLFVPSNECEPLRKLVRSELGLKPNSIVVTMVARMIRTKGVLEFVSAARKVRQSMPKVHFLLIGSRDEGSLDNLTQEEMQEVHQNVTYLGERDDVRTVLGASDIFVLPSFLREGVPRVLLEAASSALPIITTDSPGCREVVRDSVNGFLIPQRDSDSLSDAVIELARDAKMRAEFGNASRQRAIAQFDFSKVANQVRQVYKDLLSQKGSQHLVVER